MIRHNKETGKYEIVLELIELEYAYFYQQSLIDVLEALPNDPAEYSSHVEMGETIRNMLHFIREFGFDQGQVHKVEINKILEEGGSDYKNLKAEFDSLNDTHIQICKAFNMLSNENKLLKEKATKKGKHATGS